MAETASQRNTLARDDGGMVHFLFLDAEQEIYVMTPRHGAETLG